MKFKRLLAFLLSTSLIVCMMPAAVSASGPYYGSEDIDEAEITETVTDEDGEEEEKISYEACGALFTQNVTSPKKAASKSGRFGKLKWSFNGTTLTISGKGKMPNVAAEKVPWHSFRSSIKRFNIKRGVTSIGSYAFYGCKSIERGSITYGIKSIGAYAFAESNIGSITIPKTVTSIGAHAFSESFLKSIKMYNKVRSIGDYCFSGCTRLTAVSLPKSVKSIGEGAFYLCIELKSIKIPGKVTKINTGTFFNCLELTSVKIPGSVRSIGNAAFRYCEKLSAITIPGSVKTIGVGAFADTGLTKIVIPRGVNKIDNQAFYKCRKLTNVKINYGVKTLGFKVFQNSTGLEKLTIPGSVTNIGESTFLGCTGLKQVYLTEELHKNKPQAWNDCPDSAAFVYLKENPMSVSGKTATVKAKKVKKKAQSLSVSKVLSITKRGKGSVLYAKVSGNKKISVNAATGKVTIKKKLKKGTYKVRVKILATGNDTYRDSGWNVTTITIKVK